MSVVMFIANSITVVNVRYDKRKPLIVVLIYLFKISYYILNNFSKHIMIYDDILYSNFSRVTFTLLLRI